MSYLTKHELKDSLAGGHNLDAGVQKAIIDQLIADGIYTKGPSDLRAEVDPYLTSTDGRPVQVLDTFGTYSIVNTSVDPSLKVIVDDTSKDATLIVKGSTDVFVTVGTGNDTIKLNDTGHDTVLGGGGNDHIYGNGSSTLHAGTGHDTIQGYGNDEIFGNAHATGTQVLIGGEHSEVHSNSKDSNNILKSDSDASGANTLYGGAGNDTLYGGGGADELIAGSGNTQLHAGTGDHQLLKGGSGNDTLYGGSSSTSHDTLVGGSGNDTLFGAGYD